MIISLMGQTHLSAKIIGPKDTNLSLLSMEKLFQNIRFLCLPKQCVANPDSITSLHTKELNRGGLTMPGDNVCQWVFYFYMLFHHVRKSDAESA